MLKEAKVKVVSAPSQLKRDHSSRNVGGPRKRAVWWTCSEMNLKRMGLRGRLRRPHKGSRGVGSRDGQNILSSNIILDKCCFRTLLVYPTFLEDWGL